MCQSIPPPQATTYPQGTSFVSLPQYIHFARAKYCPAFPCNKFASPKWLPTTCAPGLSKRAACAACYMDRFNYKYGRPSSFLLASSPTAARQSTTQLSHTTSSQLSEPTPRSSFTCTLLFPFPARFSALHCSPHLHKRVVVAIAPQTLPSPLRCGCSQLVRLERRYDLRFSPRLKTACSTSFCS